MSHRNKDCGCCADPYCPCCAASQAVKEWDIDLSAFTFGAGVLGCDGGPCQGFATIYAAHRVPGPNQCVWQAGKNVSVTCSTGTFNSNILVQLSVASINADTCEWRLDLSSGTALGSHVEYRATASKFTCDQPLKLTFAGGSGIFGLFWCQMTGGMPTVTATPVLA